VQLPGGAASPSAYSGTIFAGPVSPFARDPRWASAMAKAAANDKPEEPGFFEKGWNYAMQNFGAGTPLAAPLAAADKAFPGFREDFGRAVTEDLATGVYETGKMGVQLSVGYSLIDPAGCRRYRGRRSRHQGTHHPGQGHPRRRRRAEAALCCPWTRVWTSVRQRAPGRRWRS